MKTPEIFAAIAFALLASACNNQGPTSDERAAKQQEIALENASQRIGIAHVNNFTEKALANRIVEMRDQPNLATYTYMQGMDGRLICLGRSIGFGLPYATQTSSPQKIVNNRYDNNSNSAYDGPMPQAEPNGLFMPDNAEGTWVVLIAPDGTPTPTYIEPRVTVSTFALTGPAVSAPCK